MQAVPREVEVADDLRPQQAHDVREHREREAGEDLLAHRRPADPLAALEDDDALAGTREVRGRDEAVVAAADDDRVVARAHARFRSGSKKGFLTTRAAARLRRCSTVTSISSAVPGAAQRERRCASAMYALRSGDQTPLVA